jgi:hypothetical protein
VYAHSLHWPLFLHVTVFPGGAAASDSPNEWVSSLPIEQVAYVMIEIRCTVVDVLSREGWRLVYEESSGGMQTT